MRAQASAEFLMIVAIMAVAIFPLLLVMSNNAQSSPEKLALGQAEFTASRLGATVDSIGSMGPGAQMRTAVELPALQSFSAQGREIGMQVMTSYGPIDIVQATRFPAKSIDLNSIHQAGSYLILVRASTTPGDENVTLSLVQ